MSAIDPPPFLGELRQEFARVAEADAAGAGASQAGASRPRRLRLPRLRLQLALPVLAALATLVIATVVVTGGRPVARHDSPGTAVAPLPSARPPEQLYTPELIERLDVLQRTRTRSAADSIGERGRAQLIAAGLLPDEAIRIPLPTLDDASATTLTLPVWVLPDRDRQVALLMQQPYEDGPTSRLAVGADRIDDNRAFTTIANDLIGIAPNGVDSVTVTIRGGGTFVLPVVDNVFGARLAAELVSVEWGGMKRP